jgi:hypothetical protein
VPALATAACLSCSIVIAARRFHPLGAAGMALNGLLYYVYFMARGLSLYATWFGAPVRRAER